MPLACTSGWERQIASLLHTYEVSLHGVYGRDFPIQSQAEAHEWIVQQFTFGNERVEVVMLQRALERAPAPHKLVILDRHARLAECGLQVATYVSRNRERWLGVA